MRRFDGVRVLILTVTGAELQGAQELEHFRMQAMYARFVSARSPSSRTILLDFGARVFDQLFNARRVNAPVDHQLGHGPFRHFAPNRVKAADGD